MGDLWHLSVGILIDRGKACRADTGLKLKLGQEQIERRKKNKIYLKM